MLQLGDELRLEPIAMDAPVLDRLWQLYTHDLSESRQTLPNEEGLFENRHLVHYRSTPDDWMAFLVTYLTRPAGFAIITDRWRGDRRTVGDFFVVRALRRRSVGQVIARELIGRYPGTWEIAFQADNAGIPKFWRGVARAVVGDAWREELRPVPGKPHVPPDHWLVFETVQAG